MKFPFLIAVTCLQLVGGVSIAAKKVPSPMKVAMAKKSTLSERDSVKVDLANHKYIYLVELALGSNQQKFTAQIDTGSSDLWVPAEAANCENGCKFSNTFDTSASSSYQSLDDTFNINYLDGSSLSGNYGKDKISFNHATKSVNVQFAVVSKTTVETPILGLGFPSLERSETKYDNLPVAMQKQGLINKVAYSLYLSSNTSSNGNILFGGIDKAKYDGDLVKFTNLDNNRLEIKLNDWSIDGESIGTETSVSIDSGASIIYLSPEQVEKISDKLGGEKVSTNSGSFYINLPCGSYQGKGKKFAFHFDGLDITIPFDDLLHNSGGDHCQFLVFPNSKLSSLGDVFLRHVYSFYNLEDREISLAQVKYTDEEDIVEV